VDDAPVTVPTVASSPTTAATTVPAAPATATAAPVAAEPTAMPVPPTPAQAASGSAVIVIVENAGTNEILGIRNRGGAALDISRWRLDGSKGDDFCVVPSGVVVEPGGMYHVATGDSQPPAPGYQCGSKTIWNNNGETIYLHSPDGAVVDAVETRG